MEDNYPDICEALGLTPEELKAALDKALKELSIEWAISDGKHEQHMWRKFWIGCMK